MSWRGGSERVEMQICTEEYEVRFAKKKKNWPVFLAMKSLLAPCSDLEPTQWLPRPKFHGPQSYFLNSSFQSWDCPQLYWGSPSTSEDWGTWNKQKASWWGKSSCAPVTTHWPAASALESGTSDRPRLPSLSPGPYPLMSMLSRRVHELSGYLEGQVPPIFCLHLQMVWTMTLQQWEMMGGKHRNTYLSMGPWPPFPSQSWIAFYWTAYHQTTIGLMRKSLKWMGLLLA